MSKEEKESEKVTSTSIDAGFNLRKLRRDADPNHSDTQDKLHNPQHALNLISTIRVHLELAENNILKHGSNKEIMEHYAGFLIGLSVFIPSVYHHDVIRNYVTNKDRELTCI